LLEGKQEYCFKNRRKTGIFTKQNTREKKRKGNMSNEQLFMCVKSMFATAPTSAKSAFT
jgi:hypothetical protein